MRGTEYSALGVPAEIDDLLHPGRRYDRPADVLMDTTLTMAQRRAILSSWASDACAVPSAPPLRRAPFSTATVSFDEIMDALLEIDRMERAQMPKRDARARHSSGPLRSSRSKRPTYHRVHDVRH